MEDLNKIYTIYIQRNYILVNAFAELVQVIYLLPSTYKGNLSLYNINKDYSQNIKISPQWSVLGMHIEYHQ